MSEAGVMGSGLRPDDLPMLIRRTGGRDIRDTRGPASPPRRVAV